MRTITRPTAATVAIGVGVAALLGLGAYEINKNNEHRLEATPAVPYTTAFDTTKPVNSVPVATAPSAMPETTTANREVVATNNTDYITPSQRPPMIERSADRYGTVVTTNASAPPPVPPFNASRFIPKTYNSSRTVSTTSTTYAPGYQGETYRVGNTVYPVANSRPVTLVQQTPTVAYVPVAPVAPVYAPPATSTTVVRTVTRRPVYQVVVRKKRRSGKIHVVRAVKHAVLFAAKLPLKLRL